MTTGENFLSITDKLFRNYKSLAEKALSVVDDEEIHFRPNEVSNNMSILVKHMSGNMLSRFTDFLTTDGEKEWRERDGEFDDTYTSKSEMMEAWQNGWDCLLNTLSSLKEGDLLKRVYIRNEAHTVLEAIARQLTHHISHVGQLIYLAKAIKGSDWEYLSIPPGKSKAEKGRFLK